MTTIPTDEILLEEWQKNRFTSDGKFIVRRVSYNTGEYENGILKEKEVHGITVRIVGDPDPPPLPPETPIPRVPGFAPETRQAFIQEMNSQRKLIKQKTIDDEDVVTRGVFRRVKQMNKVNRELLECLAKARYLSKRAAGISGYRTDGSECSIENDINATGAEYYAAQQYGQPFDATVGRKGDGGSDFTLPLTVEVVWLGVQKDGKPRDKGHLIINPDEPQRWADIYIVIKGSVDDGFEEAGWITHTALVSLPKKDFGFGEKFACDITHLKKPELLKALKRG